MQETATYVGFQKKKKKGGDFACLQMNVVSRLSSPRKPYCTCICQQFTTGILHGVYLC